MKRLIPFFLVVFFPFVISAQGLLAHWTFEEGTGTVANDSVGGYYADFMEGADWAGEGKIGANAIYLSGEGDYLQTDLLEDLQFADEFTLCTWFNTEVTFEGQQHILWIGDVAGNGYGPQQECHLSVNHFNYVDKLVFNFGDALDADGGVVNIVTAEDFIGADEWHHLAGVIKFADTDSGRITIGELYLDGVWQEPFIHEFPTRDTVYYEIMRDQWNTALRIGAAGALGSRHFRGMIDDVQIYDMALTADDIAVVMTGETVTGVQANKDGLPRGFMLANNYPNPFNPSTTISYTVGSTDLVNLNVYDVSGRFVRQLDSGIRTPGTYNVRFDAHDLPGGVYLYELRVGSSHKQIKKMVLVK